MPGAGYLPKNDGNGNKVGAFATELSIFNTSDNPISVGLDFEAVDPTKTTDPTKLSYNTSITQLQPLASHASFYSSDITSFLGGTGYGTLFIKYTGQAPTVLARIYYSSGEAGASTYGTYLPTYPINGSGPVIQGVASSTQNLVGLKFDNDFSSGITLVDTASTGGVFDVSLFKSDGTPQGQSLALSLGQYQQAKIAVVDSSSKACGGPCFLVDRDPNNILYAKITPDPNSAGATSIAIGTVVDNRTKDSLLLTDDTPRQVGSPGATLKYFIAGVGRIDGGTRTDLYMLNTSPIPLTNVNVQLHYMDSSVTPAVERTYQLAQLLTIPAGDALSISDVVTTLFPSIQGTVIGDLVIQYVPNDDQPLIIEGRNYNLDSHGGSYGMQLPAYALSDGLLPGSNSKIFLAGLHNDPDATTPGSFNFISKFGFLALGDAPVTVHVDAYDVTGGAPLFSQDYILNSGGVGHFVYQPTTGNSLTAALEGKAFNLIITATGTGNTPVAAFATVQDQHSKDLVFVPGKKPSN